MPSKKILKVLIDSKNQEKSQAEVNDFILKFIRKSKIQGQDILNKEFQDKVETMRNKMLGIKSKKEKENSAKGLRGLVEYANNLQELETKITTRLDELKDTKVSIGNDLRSIKIKSNEILNKQTDWEEIQNKPEIIGQDEFYQEQQKSEASQQRNFNLLQLLKNEVENIRDYFSQIIKGVSSEIAQLRIKKTNHSELLGITKDQHHPEKHTLDSHIITDFFTKLKRLVSGDYVDDLHKHKIGKIEQIREWYGGGFRGVNTNQITVSATEPTSPELNDLWIDIS